jgi:hypothetical protein
LYQTAELHTCRHGAERQLLNLAPLSFTPYVHDYDSNPSHSSFESSILDEEEARLRDLHTRLSNASAPNEPFHYQTQSSPHLYRPPWSPDYHLPAQQYAYLEPSTHISDNEGILRLDALYRWQQRVIEVAHLRAHSSTPGHPFPEPVVIWHAPREKVFQLMTAPAHPLMTGSELEGFGLAVGNWRLTAKRERQREWTKKRRLVEWVYCMCQNDATQQETWLKMPADYYYPPSVTMRVKASIRKISSLLAFRSRK